MNRPFGTLLVLATLGLAGCGESWQAETYPATGRLLVNGEPAPGALVQLVARGNAPDVRNSRPWGKVRDDGSFELTTYGPEPGAPPGEYAVGITWPVDASVMGSPDQLGGKFADATTSGVTVTLKAEPNQIPEIRLDKVRVDSRPKSRTPMAPMAKRPG